MLCYDWTLRQKVGELILFPTKVVLDAALFIARERAIKVLKGLMVHSTEDTQELVEEVVAPERPPPFPVAQSVGGGGVDVRSRSFVRSLSSPRQPKRLGGTSRNVVLFFFFVPLRHT